MEEDSYGGRHEADRIEELRKDVDGVWMEREQIAWIRSETDEA